MVTPFRVRFLDVICKYRAVAVFFLALNVVFLLLSLVALPFVSSGSESAVILGVNFAIVLTVITTSCVLLYLCRRHDDGGRSLQEEQ